MYVHYFALCCKGLILSFQLSPELAKEVFKSFNDKINGISVSCGRNISLKEQCYSVYLMQNWVHTKYDLAVPIKELLSLTPAIMVWTNLDRLKVVSLPFWLLFHLPFPFYSLARNINIVLFTDRLVIIIFHTLVPIRRHRLLLPSYHAFPFFPFIQHSIFHICLFPDIAILDLRPLTFGGFFVRFCFNPASV